MKITLGKTEEMFDRRMKAEIDGNLESFHKGLCMIRSGSGVTRSLFHASVSGIYVARHIDAQN